MDALAGNDPYSLDKGVSRASADAEDSDLLNLGYNISNTCSPRLPRAVCARHTSAPGSAPCRWGSTARSHGIHPPFPAHRDPRGVAPELNVAAARGEVSRSPSHFAGLLTSPGLDLCKSPLASRRRRAADQRCVSLAAFVALSLGV